MYDKYLNEINEHPHLSKIIAKLTLEHKITQSLVYKNSVTLEAHNIRLENIENSIGILQNDVSTLKGDVNTLKGDVSDIKDMLKVLIERGN